MGRDRLVDGASRGPGVAREVRERVRDARIDAERLEPGLGDRVAAERVHRPGVLASAHEHGVGVVRRNHRRDEFVHRVPVALVARAGGKRDVLRVAGAVAHPRSVGPKRPAPSPSASTARSAVAIALPAVRMRLRDREPSGRRHVELPARGDAGQGGVVVVDAKVSHGALPAAGGSPVT